MSDQDYLSEIPLTTLEGAVLVRMREAIIEGVFKPGSQLNQVQVAANFGTSRGPIRAAINKLEEEGLVKNIPHKGTFVTPLEKEDVMDLYGVRASLEPYGVRLTIPRCSTVDIDNLYAAYEKMQSFVGQKNTKEMIQQDLDFHQFFIRLSGNQVLQQVWASLLVRVRRVLAFRYFSYPYLQEMADSHVEILKLAENRKAEDAAHLMEGHIMEALQDILNRWED